MTQQRSAQRDDKFPQGVRVVTADNLPAVAQPAFFNLPFKPPGRNVAVHFVGEPLLQFDRRLVRRVRAFDDRVKETLHVGDRRGGFREAFLVIEPRFL